MWTGVDKAEIPRDTRDYRIDFLRGLALLSIFVNHVRDNFYERFTHKNFGLSDAAEVFVILAGVSAALAFYPKYVKGGHDATMRQIGGRIGSLYFWHISMTMFALSMFVFAGAIFSNPELFKEINIGPVIADPLSGFLGLFGMGHQLGYFNILPMYMVLLALLPVVMSLYKVNIKLLLAVSISLYLLAGYFYLGLPNYPNKGVWFFNPLSWQLLYVVGFAGWLYAREHGGIPYNKYVFWAAVVMLVWWCLWVQFGWWHLWSYVTMKGAVGALWGFNKSFISIPRLLHVLALAYVFIHSPLPGLLQRIISKNNPIVRIGQHGLHLFCFGSVLSMFLLIIRIQLGGGILLDTVLVGFGIYCHFALAHYLSRPDKTKTDGPLVAGGVGPGIAT